jgi:hypothetical protein
MAKELELFGGWPSSAPTSCSRQTEPVAAEIASLRQRFGLEAGERVAIVAKNSPA